MIETPTMIPGRQGSMAGLQDAVESEDRLVSLRSLRDKIAYEIDNTASAREIASLAARMMDVLQQIEQVEQRQPPRSSARDEIAARRAAKATRARRPERKAQ